MGQFIVIEAVDRTGKTSQLKAIRGALVRRGLSVALTEYPDRQAALTGELIQRFLTGDLILSPELDADDGVVKSAAEYRQMLLGQMLFSLNRRETNLKLERLIAQHDVVISSRHQLSGLAYGEGGGVRRGDLLQLFAALEDDLRKPDLTIIIDADPALLLERSRQGDDAFDSNLHLQQRARQSYLRAAEEHGLPVVNGLTTLDGVTTQVLAVIDFSFPELATREVLN